MLKGNLRFLYSPCSEIREEAIYRLIWLLQMEKDSLKKLPRLSSLHGLPLGSLCIFEYKTLNVKRAKGNYEVTYNCFYIMYLTFFQLFRKSYSIKILFISFFSLL